MAHCRGVIRRKQLGGNHMAEELLLLAMVLDRALIEAPAEWVNYKTTELALRRMDALERAFESVR